MEQVLAEKKAAESKETREDRPGAKGVAKLVEEPVDATAQKELPKAPAQAEAARAKELPKAPASAVAAQEKKMAKAPTQVEADYRRKCKEELEDWYAEVPWRPDFVERYSSPLVTISAVWTVVDEVFSPKGRIPQPEWDQIQRASRFFGRLLRHGENDRWAPMRDANQSICMELAYNVAILRGILAPSCTPADI
jgi:hypothetical protein